MPNDYIRCDIRKKYGISRKFYITYILIDRYMSLENYSWLTINEILRYYKVKTTKHKPKAFSEILDVLKYMNESKMIEIQQDLDSASYDTGIKIVVKPNYFDSNGKYCMIPFNVLDKIMDSETTVNKEAALLSYLYIGSYIGGNVPQNETETDEQYLKRLKNFPKAFFRDINNMAKDLSMSKDTITKCINYLQKEGLIIKKTVGSIKRDCKPPQNVPNIYVLNQKGYEQEIEWALEKMKKNYNVDYFEEIKGGNKNK